MGAQREGAEASIICCSGGRLRAESGKRLIDSSHYLRRGLPRSLATVQRYTCTPYFSCFNEQGKESMGHTALILYTVSIVKVQ